MKLVTGFALAMLVLCAVVSAPAQAAAPKGPSLYSRLGQEPGIALLIENFVNKVAGDKRINGRFAHTNIPHLKKCLTTLVVQLSGGPKKYECRSMRDSHKGMGITDAEFDALVGDFVWAENKCGVDKWSQKQLAGALLATRKDIVEVHKPGFPSEGAKSKAPAGKAKSSKKK